MNLYKLGPSSWIIFLNLILLIVLVYILSTKHRDSFINYPQQVDPNTKPKSNSEANSVNNNYASILMYIQNKPSDSFNFIKDVKSKFFDDSCKVKSNIDFANIASMPGGLPFGND
jgi:uncharacterized membrane protein